MRALDTSKHYCFAYSSFDKKIYLFKIFIKLKTENEIIFFKPHQFVNWYAKHINQIYKINLN